MRPQRDLCATSVTPVASFFGVDLGRAAPLKSVRAGGGCGGRGSLVQEVQGILVAGVVI